MESAGIPGLRKICNDMKMLNHKILLRAFGLLALSWQLASCTEPLESVPGDSAAERVVRVTASSFPTAGSTGAVAGEERIEQMHAYLFEEGLLTRIDENLPLSGNGCDLRLDRLSGTLYVVANAHPELISGPLSEGLSEREWLAATIGKADAATADFSTGRLDLGAVPAGSAVVPLTLTRGTARFDLRLRVAGSVSVEAFTLLGAARTGYLLPQERIATPPSAVRTEVAAAVALPLTEDTPGVAYLYEQENADLRVRVEAEIDGKPCTLEGALPRTVGRNRIYTVTLRKDLFDTDVQLSVEAWGDGGSTDLDPDLEGVLTVDELRSTIPSDVQVADGGRTLRLPYTETEILLAVASAGQLEVVPRAEFPLTVEEVSTGGSPDDMNLFRIRKARYAPGRPSEEIEVRFRRKGLEQFYPEDRILLQLAANPTRVEGLLDFDNAAYETDFGRYVDNELGVFTLPEGKELLAEFGEGEDPWVRIAPAPEDANTFRVLGGWRPNDPTADGRRQAARLVIRSRADGSEREEYTVVRRNWGLPVTWFHGVWWCKYNARGNSRRFEDQVLSSADPAAQAGKSVFNYLASCTAEEFYDLWGWAYQGDNGLGMRVVDQDGVAVMEGFSTDSSVHINKLPADALSPDGYELPTMEEFNRVFDATDYIWMMWGGTHTLREPWEGHSRVSRAQQRRNDLVVGTLSLSDLISVRMWSTDFPSDEGITWYGPGAQWNADGIMHSGHYNNILFGVHSPEGSGWYIGGGMGNLYMTKNGAGTKDTRILRFKKSDVEYIYGISDAR